MTYLFQPLLQHLAFSFWNTNTSMSLPSRILEIKVLGSTTSPKFIVTGGSSVTFPALSCIESLVSHHLDVLDVLSPPKYTSCINASRLCEGCSFMECFLLLPSHAHPLSFCQILQVQCLTVQMFFGPRMLSWLPLLLPHSSQWVILQSTVFYMFVYLLVAGYPITPLQ